MEKALLIFDVDETLLHATEEILDYPPDFQLFHYHVYKRPGLHAFLGSVSNNYRISIWSSASEDYVEQCIKNVGVLPFRFEFVWSRSRCTRKMDWDAHEEQYIKDLKKVKRRGYSLERTLIVDDSRHKVSRQYGNAVYIKPFEGQREDRELGYLLEYLQRIKDVENFRSLEKRDWRSTVKDFVSNP